MSNLEKLGENLQASSLAAASNAAIGFGAGLLAAASLSKRTRHKLAIGLITVGAAALIPIIAGLITRISNRPNSPHRVRKQLESIRQGHGLSENVTEEAY